MAVRRTGDGSLTQDQLAAAVSAALPQPAAAAAGRGAAPQNQTPKPEDVEKMMAALPDKAPAKPKQPRKVLVLAKAAGFVHSCIPLAAKTVEALGTKTGAWSTTVTYDPAAITARESEAVRSAFPGQHHGSLPRRSQRRGLPPPPAERRCSSSSGPARAWPGFTPPAIPTMKPAPRPRRACQPRRHAAAPAQPSPPRCSPPAIRTAIGS